MNVLPMVFEATNTPKKQWAYYIQDLKDLTRGRITAIAETLKKTRAIKKK